jgi:hypothetical protein
MAACACATPCPITEPIPVGKILTFEAAEHVPPQTEVAVATINSMTCAFAFEGCGLPYALLGYDRACSGALSAKMRAAGFSGRLGEQLIIDLATVRISLSASPRFIMLFGLGAALPQGDQPLPAGHSKLLQDTLCAAFGAFAKGAAELDAQELAVAFNGLRVHRFKMAAGAAVLRCRMTIELNRHNSPVSRFYVLCDHLDRLEVEFGLSPRPQLCMICSEPCFV